MVELRMHPSFAVFFLEHACADLDSHRGAAQTERRADAAGAESAWCQDKISCYSASCN
jgi:hypothetical protein